MSRTVVDPTTYLRQIALSKARYIRRGYSQWEAEGFAKELVDSCFICLTDQLQVETQRDRDDERNGDWTR